MRLEGWENRLAAYLEAGRKKPFVWGEHDCALWCARWIRDCTGTDYTRDWEGRYTTAAEARALMAERGFNDYSDIADSVLTVTPIMLAQRGDIILHPNGGLGICNGRLSHFIGETEAFTEETLACARAWKVD